MLVAYLNNPSEEAIFEVIELRSNMKQCNFKMKKLWSAKHFKPSLMNSTDQQSETSRKKAICIIQLAIVYSVLTLT